MDKIELRNKNGIKVLYGKAQVVKTKAPEEIRYERFLKQNDLRHDTSKGGFERELIQHLQVALKN